MKKLTMLFLLMMISLKMLAPEYKCLLICESKPINSYDILVNAVVMVESRNGLYVWNPKERAVGHFQIRQIRVNEYNRRTNSNYKLTDFYDYELSKKMFLYFAQGKSFEKAAKDWNGSGPKTKEYWKKVKLNL